MPAAPGRVLDLAIVALGDELWRNRRYVFGGALRELRHRYAGTGMGLAWHVIVPLFQVAVYLVVFSALIGTPSGDRSVSGYSVFLCAGLLPWLVFAECVGRGSLALLANENYLKKLPIPDSVFVAQSIVTSGYTLALYAVLLTLLALATGVPLRWTWLLAAPVLLLFLGLCLGLTLTFATLTVFFRDVAQALTLLLQIWFWLTPVVYSPTILPPWLRRVVTWNPPSAYIAGVRGLLLEGRVPEWREWAWMATLALVACAVGASVLRGLHSDLRDAL
jgi:lipopolysaccharide transport system permease protein